MLDNYLLKFYPVILLLLIVLLLIIKYSNNKRKGSLKLNNISEFSFQKFGKFYGQIILPDENFNKKINKIYELITVNKKTDLEEIAKLSNCEYNECVLKIKYMKNKRILGDYYIDTISREIKKCSPEDKKLIKKYSPYIYGNHYQIDEIARKLPNSRVDNLSEIEDQVLKELDYLDKKNLINGINIDRVDKKIIYYTIEKHKKEMDYISLNCKNCGALNDVPKKGKARCEYCETIVEDNEEI